MRICRTHMKVITELKEQVQDDVKGASIEGYTMGDSWCVPYGGLLYGCMIYGVPHERYGCSMGGSLCFPYKGLF